MVEKMVAGINVGVFGFGIAIIFAIIAALIDKKEVYCLKRLAIP